MSLSTNMDIGYSNFLFSQRKKASVKKQEKETFLSSPPHSTTFHYVYIRLIRKVAYVCIHNEMEICGNTTVQQKNEATKQPPFSSSWILYVCVQSEWV